MDHDAATSVGGGDFNAPLDERLSDAASLRLRVDGEEAEAGRVSLQGRRSTGSVLSHVGEIDDRADQRGPLASDQEANAGLRRPFADFLSDS